MGYAKEEKKYIRAQKHGKKEKEKKDSPYFKKKEIESCRKGCEFHPEKFHTLAHLDLIV